MNYVEISKETFSHLYKSYAGGVKKLSFLGNTVTEKSVNQTFRCATLSQGDRKE